MTSERMIMVPDWLVEEAASLIEQAGLSGTGVSLAAPRLRAALARPAAGEPIHQWADQDLWMDGDEADMASARANGFKTRTLWTAPPAAAHGDEAVRKDADRYRWIAANVTEAEVGRSSEFHIDWRRAWKLPLLLSQNAVAATFTFDEAIDAAMRAQGDGEPRHG